MSRDQMTTPAVTTAAGAASDGVISSGWGIGWELSHLAPPGARTAPPVATRANVVSQSGRLGERSPSSLACGRKCAVTR